MMKTLNQSAKPQTLKAYTECEGPSRALHTLTEQKREGNTREENSGMHSK